MRIALIRAALSTLCTRSHGTRQRPAGSVRGARTRCCGEDNMTWDNIQAQWEEFGPQLSDRWGRLTDDDVLRARAGRDALIDCVQQRYRIDLDLAQRHV